MADEARLAHIKARLEEDLPSLDLQWSLMVAALSSYRHDTVLKPFPPMFAEGTDFKDYAGMVWQIDSCIDTLNTDINIKI